MSKTNSFYETVDQIVTYGVEKGILHLVNQDESFEGNELILSGKKVVNFGSCSYLGLEFDERLKDGARQAIDRYGTQFSESRAYVSLKPYQELECLLNEVFKAFCVVSPTTTLGHIAAIPVLIKDEEVVILDHQVHNSVQTAVNLLKARGVPVELIRHNRMDILEERVKSLRGKYRKIWYMADGIYSMYGDFSPVDQVYQLMDKYPELHFYVDDAHGMSIFGENGRGSVLNNRAIHPKMILAASLNKAFASGGGVLVFPNPEQARKVRTCGGPLLTSGPMQPSSLGAAVACAKIHLSEDIYNMQEELRDRIRFTHLMLAKYRLPIVSQSDASIFFVGVSLPKLGYNMIQKMLHAGYYLNLGIFPAVPMKNTGVRFTVTRLHSFSQIEQMVSTMAAELPKALREEEMDLEQIYKAFKLPLPEEQHLDQSVSTFLKQSLSLKIEHKQSIQQIHKDEWNEIFEGKGSFDWDGLKTLENTFRNNKLPQDNWLFDYLLIRDMKGRVVVATFLTTTIWKDDMLSPSGISRQVEEKRISEAYYLTSKVISTGSLLTEGEHLYTDKNSLFWKDALRLLFEKIYALQEKYEANQIVLRDFHSIDSELDQLMVDNGFFRFSMPETNLIEEISWSNPDQFYQQLSRCSRDHFRKKVRRYEHEFETEVITSDSPSMIDQWYQLYENVKEHSLELNTFALPKKLFAQLLENPNWEVLTLKLKKQLSKKEAVCVVFCYKSGSSYNPMIIGIDYQYNGEFHVYRQALYQVVLRAATLRKQKIYLGFSASIEKKKVGSKATPVYAYMHTKDSYNHQVLSEINKISGKLSYD